MVVLVVLVPLVHTCKATGTATGMAHLIKPREMQLRLVVNHITVYDKPTADAAVSVVTSGIGFS